MESLAKLRSTIARMQSDLTQAQAGLRANTTKVAVDSYLQDNTALEELHYRLMSDQFLAKVLPNALKDLTHMEALEYDRMQREERDANSGEALRNYLAAKDALIALGHRPTKGEADSFLAASGRDYSHEGEDLLQKLDLYYDQKMAAGGSNLSGTTVAPFEFKSDFE
jgi:hypothetical protein